MSSPSDKSDSSLRHPIAVVSERTGLSQDILRMWERRYGAVSPTRNAGGERLYSDADVARLRLLDAAVAAGRRISRVAGLSTPELEALVADDRAAQSSRVSGAPAARDAPPNALVEAALDRARALDARGLDEMLRRGAAVAGAPAFLEETIAPLLVRIGEMWHAGRISIGAEHVASAVIEAFTADVMRSLTAPGAARSVVVATPAGSRHVMGASLVAAAAAAEGWNVIFLGGDLPVAEIARAAAESGARAVALSVVYAADAADLVAQLRLLRERLAADVALIVGGRAVLPHARALSRSGLIVGETLDSLRSALRGVSEGTARA